MITKCSATQEECSMPCKRRTIKSNDPYQWWFAGGERKGEYCEYFIPEK